MEAQILAIGKNESAPAFLRNLHPPFIDLRSNEKIIFVVNQGGMASGEPSVSIVSTAPGVGTVFLATSLDKFLMGAQGMVGMAESKWGWKLPEGYAKIMPDLSKKKRREILESIKKELEEWDDVDE
jgi:hypothetical protein